MAFIQLRGEIVLAKFDCLSYSLFWFKCFSYELLIREIIMYICTGCSALLGHLHNSRTQPKREDRMYLLALNYLNHRNK